MGGGGEGWASAEMVLLRRGVVGLEEKVLEAEKRRELERDCSGG